ncbi:hypothetical protein POVWA1_014090 [Plasmodium ovale wallikeri]|nr:hypothetical protein POVWA1_014090 [Plasmodium ovale wallikeri]
MCALFYVNVRFYFRTHRLLLQSKRSRGKATSASFAWSHIQVSIRLIYHKRQGGISKGKQLALLLTFCVDLHDGLSLLDFTVISVLTPAFNLYVDPRAQLIC